MTIACACGRPARHPFRPGRRALLGLAAGAFACAALAAPARAASGPPTSLTADQALAELQAGNRAFMAGQPFRGAMDPARRAAIANHQAPFAAILTCADSRLPPEILFNRGLGEIFVVRNAGNLADTGAIGSLEYAVAELGVPLVVVLGHERCGAVAAAVSVMQQGTLLPGSIGPMVEPILPAAIAARTQPGDLVENAIAANARRVAARIPAASQIIGGPVAAGRVKVLAARYDLDDGAVAFLPT